MKILNWFEERNIYYKMVYIFYGIISVTFLKEIPYLTAIFSFVMVLLSFIYFCIFLVKGYYFRMSKVRYLLIIFLVFQLSSFIVSKNYISDFIKLVFNVIFFFIISITTNKNKNDINRIFKFLVDVISPIVFLSLITYYFKLNFKINNNIYGRIEDYDSSSKTLLGITVNINTLGILCAFLLIVSIHLIISQKQDVKRRSYLYFTIFISGITLIHTQARGAIVTLLIYIFMIIILSLKKRINKIIGLLIGILTPILVLFKILPSLNIEEISTGRTLLWRAAIDVIKKNPVWGVGTTAYVDIVKKSSDSVLHGIETGGLHNIYFQIATANGLITFTVFMIFILVSLLTFTKKILFVDYKEYNKINASVFSIIVSLLALNLFESSLIYIMSFIALIFWICFGELLKNMDLE
jgi:O-antigen ligase